MERIRGIADKFIRLLTIGTTGMTVALGTGGCEPKKNEPVVTVDPMDQPKEAFHVENPFTEQSFLAGLARETGIPSWEVVGGGDGARALLQMEAETTGQDMSLWSVGLKDESWKGAAACLGNECGLYESSAKNQIDPSEESAVVVLKEVAVQNEKIVASPHKGDGLKVAITGDGKGGVKVESVEVVQTSKEGVTQTPPAKATPTTPAQKADVDNWFTKFLMGLGVIKPTAVPIPTISGPEPTATTIARPTEEPTPEPTAVLINEKDLEPFYVNPANVEFMGVRINSELIVDDSISTSIKKVTVPDNVWAEFVARTLFKVWWSKGEVKHTTASTEADFKAFMALMAKAQAGSDPADWRAIQINNVWANDLNDGNGYVQEPYSIWPMFSGQAPVPEDVRAVSQLSIALVRTAGVKNITDYDDESYGLGMGVNIDNDTLFVYAGVASGFYHSGSISSLISATGWWMKQNSGGSYSGIGVQDIELYNLLYKKGGLRVY